MNVGYLGPLRDYSGYGEANRHFVAALDAAGAHVVPKLVNYVTERSDFGELGRRIDELIEQRAGDDYRVKILHTTPDEYRRFMEPGKYHIGHFFWETDRVPHDFVEAFKDIDEIWTGSEANKKALLSTGVEKPVYIFPQPIETEREWPEKYEVPGFDGYLFYSIFEWTDRKNPEALLKAFYEEFGDDPDSNVGIVFKTYFRNFTLNNKRMIRAAVGRLKSQMTIKDYPPVMLYLDLMDRRQVSRLHSTGDCYVSAHRGEGWGVPQVEAALAGNPIISTGYGGCHEYFEDGKNAIILPYHLTQLKGMAHAAKWYTADQKWAEVDHGALRKAMRNAYDNQKSYEKIGAAGQKLVREQFNLERVGKLMLGRLEQIEEELNA